MALVLAIGISVPLKDVHANPPGGLLYWDPEDSPAGGISHYTCGDTYRLRTTGCPPNSWGTMYKWQNKVETTDVNYLYCDSDGDSYKLNDDGTIREWACPVSGEGEKHAYIRVTWANGTKTNYASMDCDCTDPTITMNAPDFSSNTWTGFYSDPWGSGFDDGMTVGWGTPLFDYAKNVSTGKYYAPGDGYTLTSPMDLRYMTCTNKKYPDNSPASYPPYYKANLSKSGSYFPLASSHVCGDSYEWKVTGGDWQGDLNYIDVYTTFTATAPYCTNCSAVMPLMNASAGNPCDYSSGGACWIKDHSFTASSSPISSSPPCPSINQYEMCISANTNTWKGCDGASTSLIEGDSSFDISSSNRPDNGKQRLYFVRGIDSGGHRGPFDANVYLLVRSDFTPPTLSVNASQVVSFSDPVPAGADFASGIDKARYKWNGALNGDCTDGSSMSNGDTIACPSAGSHHLYLCTKDKVGNISRVDQVFACASAQCAITNVTITASDYSPLVGEFVNFTGNAEDNGNCGTGPWSWAWDFSDINNAWPSSSAAQNPTEVFYVDTNPAVVNLTASRGTGSGSAQTTISPTDPAGCTFDLGMIADPGFAGTSPFHVTLTAVTSNVSNCTGSPMYEWKKDSPDYYVVGSVTQPYDYTNPPKQNYTAWVQVTWDGTVHQEWRVISVNPVAGDPIPVGTHTSAGCHAITGWTCDPSNYSSSILVHLYDGNPAAGGTFLAQTTANLNNADSCAPCGGGCLHGFSIDTPSSLKDSADHDIYAYAINVGPLGSPNGGPNPLLNLSPKTVNCVPPPINFTFAVQPSSGLSILPTTFQISNIQNVAKELVYYTYLYSGATIAADKFFVFNGAIASQKEGSKLDYNSDGKITQADIDYVFAPYSINNLLTNPGFETPGLPVPFASSLPGSNVARDTANARSGVASLRLFASQNDTYTHPGFGSALAVIDTSPDALGIAYSFGVWAKGSRAGASTQLHVFCMTNAYSLVEAIYPEPSVILLDTNWHYYNVIKQCPVGTQKVGVRIDNNIAGDTIYIDDAVLFRVNLLPNPGFEGLLMTKNPFKFAANGNLSLDNGVGEKYDGAQSLKLVATANDAYTTPYEGSIGARVDEITGYTEYNFATYARASAPNTSMDLYIFCLNPDNTIRDIKATTHSVGLAWDAYNVTHICPAGSKYIGVRVDNNTSGRTMWYDAMKVTKKPACPPDKVCDLDRDGLINADDLNLFHAFATRKSWDGSMFPQNMQVDYNEPAGPYVAGACLTDMVTSTCKTAPVVIDPPLLCLVSNVTISPSKPNPVLGESVTFTGSAEATAACGLGNWTYEWTFPNGTPASQTNTHGFTPDTQAASFGLPLGIKNVCLTVRRGTGFASDCTTINVAEPPCTFDLDMGAIPGWVGFDPFTVTLSAITSNPQYCDGSPSYEWRKKVGDAFTPGTINQIYTYDPDTPPDVQLAPRVRVTWDGVPKAVSKTVTVKPQPCAITGVTLTSDKSIANKGENIAFTATGTSSRACTDPWKFEWTFPGGTPPNATITTDLTTNTNTQSANFSTKGNKTITVKVLRGTESMTQTLQVNIRPCTFTADFITNDLIPPDFTGLVPYSVIFTAQTSAVVSCLGSPTYQWTADDPANPFVPDDATFPFTYNFAGTFSACMKVNWDDSAPILKCKPVKVDPLPCTVHDAVISYSPPSPLVNQNVAFSATAKSENCGAAPWEYSWKFTDGTPTTSTNATPSIKFSPAGSKLVELTMSKTTMAAGKVSTSTSTTINIGNPGCTFTASLVPDPPSGSDPLTVILTASATQTGGTCNGVPSYEWRKDSPEGSFSPGTETQTYIYTPEGRYLPCVKISWDGASVITCTEITVKTPDPCVISNPVITADKSIANKGEVITFTGSATASPTCTGDWTYTWTFPDGTPASKVNVSALSPNTQAATFSVSGIKQVSLVVSKGASSSPRAKLPVTIRPCSFTGELTADPGQKGEVPFSVALTALTGHDQSCLGTPKFQWKKDTGFAYAPTVPDETSTQSYTYTSIGHYLPCAMITWDDAPPVESCLDINAIPAPECVVSNVTISADNWNPIVNEPVRFSGSAEATAACGNGAWSYIWDFQDGTADPGLTDPTPTVRFSPDGEKEVTLKMSKGTGDSKSSATIKVRAPDCFFNVRISAVPGFHGADPFAVVLTAAVTDVVNCPANPKTYEWNKDSKNPMETYKNGTSSQDYVYSPVGAYLPCVHLTWNGVTVEKCADITVTEPVPCSVSTTVYPTSGRAPLTVRFNAIPSNCSEPYNPGWDYNDPGGWTDWGKMATDYTYTAKGTYQPMLLFSHGDGTIPPQNTLPVTVCEFEVTASANPDSGDSPLMVSLDGALSDDCVGGGRLHYLWDFGDGEVSPDLGSPNTPHFYVNETGGPMTFRATLTAIEGAYIDSDEIEIVVAPSPPNRAPVVTFSRVIPDRVPADPKTEPRTFIVDAVDPDGDELAYTYYAWHDEKREIYQIIADKRLPVPDQDGSMLDYNRNNEIDWFDAPYAEEYINKNGQCMPKKICDLDDDGILEFSGYEGKTQGDDLKIYLAFMKRNTPDFTENIEYTYASDGKYNAAVVAKDEGGLSGIDSREVIVGDTSCSLSIGIKADPERGPAPLEVFFRGSPDWTGYCGGVVTESVYTWAFGTGDTQSNINDPEAFYTYMNPGSYKVILTAEFVRDGVDYQATSELWITADPASGTPIISIITDPVDWMTAPLTLWTNENQTADVDCDQNGGAPCIPESYRLMLYNHSSVPASCPVEYPVYTDCGNGTVNPGEQCDDSNMNAGDGCSASCFWEVLEVDCSANGPIPENAVWNTVSDYASACTASDGSACTNRDYPVDTTNEYNVAPSTTSCQFKCKSGYFWMPGFGTCVIPPSTCGNSIVEGVEECDNGAKNGIPGSGCADDCAWETMVNSCPPKVLSHAVANTVTEYSSRCTATDKNTCTLWNPALDSNTNYDPVESVTSCRFTCEDGWTWDGDSCEPDGALACYFDSLTDAGLQECIIATLGKTNWSEVTESDLLTITTLPCTANPTPIVDIHGVGCLSNLTTLDLSHNAISSLPKEIKFLIKLERAGLNNNALVSLPPEIQYLKALWKFDVSNNALTSLPTEIGYLTSLEAFGAEGNALATIPSSIGLLSEVITHINLADNAITTLPDEFGYLTLLDNIVLSDNLLSDIPKGEEGMNVSVMEIRNNSGLTCSSENITTYNPDTCTDL